jgi:hypothetical protein
VVDAQRQVINAGPIDITADKAASACAETYRQHVNDSRMLACVECWIISVRSGWAMNADVKGRNHSAVHHRCHSTDAWVLGIVGTYTIGAFVHVLLVGALLLFVVGLLSGRRSMV